MCSLLSVLVSVDWVKKERKLIIARSIKRCQTSLQGKYKSVWQIWVHKPVETQSGLCRTSLPTAQAPKGKLHSGRAVWPRTQGLTLFQHRFLWNCLQQRKHMQDRSPGEECEVNMWVNWRVEWMSYEVPVYWNLHFTAQKTQQCFWMLICQ